MNTYNNRWVYGDLKMKRKKFLFNFQFLVSTKILLNFTLENNIVHFAMHKL